MTYHPAHSGMLIMILALAGLVLGSGPGAPPGSQDRALIQKARQVMKEVPLIDGHNDAPWQYRSRASNHLEAIDFAGGTGHLDPPMHTDLPRLRAGGVSGRQHGDDAPVAEIEVWKSTSGGSLLYNFDIEAKGYDKMFTLKIGEC